MRGIALKTMVGLIIAILVGVVILLVMYSSGVMENFKESTILMLTTISSYFRIGIVNVMNILIAVLATILLIIFIFKVVSGGFQASNLIGLSKAIGGLSLKTAAIGWGIFGLTSINAIASFIMFAIISTQILPMIPLYAPTININIGTVNHPEDNTTNVAVTIAEKIDNTWRAFGSGNGNPLEGLNDPRLFYTIFVHLKDDKTLTLHDVYTNLTKHYGGGYPIYVYCKNSQGVLGDPNIGNKLSPVLWITGCDTSNVHTIQNYGDKCEIKDGSEIKIYYLDAINTINIYANFYQISQPSSCPYICGVGDVKDSVVVCVT